MVDVGHGRKKRVGEIAGRGSVRDRERGWVIGGEGGTIYGRKREKGGGGERFCREMKRVSVNNCRGRERKGGGSGWEPKQDGRLRHQGRERGHREVVSPNIDFPTVPNVMSVKRREEKKKKNAKFRLVSILWT